MEMQLPRCRGSLIRAGKDTVGLFLVSFRGACLIGTAHRCPSRSILMKIVGACYEKKAQQSSSMGKK